MLYMQSVSIRGCGRSVALWARLLVLLTALFHAGLVLATCASSSHQAGDILAHDHALLTADFDDHAHHHDATEADGEAYHQHDHNPIDHSHDKLNLPPGGFHATFTAPQLWNAVSKLSEYPPPYAAFERPPKAFSVL